MSSEPLVHFVGAGSGAPDLITVRGRRLLRQADVVVWAGSLVNGELLSCCRRGCEFHDSSRLSLAETDAILRTAARAGRQCVRLHTGDPSIYGAVREQMALLDAAGIAYDVVPGVSSMFAAAASLRRELTVPGVSQTVIVTRMEGRTPVPERERVRSLSAHGATMVLFLSAHALEGLSAELLAGGAYTEETPCAVVYRASWQDERIVRGTVADIARKAQEAGITKTALVLVGDFLGGRYGTSFLYDERFSTSYRATAGKAADGDRQPQQGTTITMTPATTDGASSSQQLATTAADVGEQPQSAVITTTPATADGASSSQQPIPVTNAVTASQGAVGTAAASVALVGFGRVAVVCFTARGALHSRAIVSALSSATRTEVVALDCFGERHAPLADFCRSQFAVAHDGTSTLLVFVGAAGIAVRTIAPFIKDKRIDPAVICIDDSARFVIPLLSGHLGGANDAARALAAMMGAVAVVTTATDVHGLWAVDDWARVHRWYIPDRHAAKRISAALLAGKRVLALGVGCRRNVDDAALLSFVRSVLMEQHIPEETVRCVATIDLKRDEHAICALAQSLGVPFVTYGADALNAVSIGGGVFSASDFVRGVTGTDCVCERAACAAAHSSADWLLVRKTVCGGMTVAVAAFPDP